VKHDCDVYNDTRSLDFKVSWIEKGKSWTERLETEPMNFAQACSVGRLKAQTAKSVTILKQHQRTGPNAGKFFLDRIIK
jgi:hypothetical protein